MKIRVKLFYFTIFLLTFVTLPTLSQTICTNLKSFTNSVLATNEQQIFSLLDYFQGPNLQFQFTATNNYNGYIENKVATLGTPYANIFPSFQTAKIYKQSQSFGNILGLLITSIMPNQIQLFSSPTILAPIALTTPTIILSANLTCSDFEFLNNEYIIADCYNTTSSQHTLQVYSVTTGSLITSKTFPLLSQGTGNVRTLSKIQIGINNYIILILNQFTAMDSFIEVVRITTTSQVIIHTLPPINKQFFDITSNFSIISMTQASDYLILAVQQNYIYKLTLNFTYVQFTMQYKQFQLDPTATLQSIQSEFAGSILHVFYAYSQNNSNYIQQIDWTHDTPLTVTNYQVDASMKTIQMQILHNFLVTYITNADAVNFRSQIVVYQKGNLDFQNWFESNMPIVYQTIPIATNFAILSSYQNNQLIILSNGATQLLNYQQMIQFQLPTLILSQSLTTYPDSIAVSISCMGNYIALNSTQNQELVFTQQASSVLNFKPISMNTAYVQQLVAGYSSQLLSSEFPGATAVTIPPYVQGPNLQYSISIASNSSNWTKPQYSFLNVQNLYSKTNFAFPLPNSYITSHINLVEIIQVEVGVSEWLVQITDTGVSTLYLIVEDLNFQGYFYKNNIILLAPIFIYDRTVLSSFTGQIISLQWISPTSFMYVTSTSPCTLNIHNFGEVTDQVFSEQLCLNTTNNSIQRITYVERKAYIAMTNSILIIHLKTEIHSVLELKQAILQAQTLTSSSFSNTNLFNIGTFLPINILRDWNRKHIIYVQTSSYVIIVDYETYFIYEKIVPSSITSNYVICVTTNSLVLVQNGYSEYAITNLTNIIQTKSSLPIYNNQAHTFSVSNALIKSSKQYLYLLDTAQNNAVIIIQPGLPMFCTIKQILSLGTSFSQAQFLFINNQNQFSETLTLFSSANFLAVYNNFYQPTLTISGFINGTLQTVQQKKQDNFWFNVQISSASNTGTTATIQSIPYQIQMNYNQQTEIHLNSSSSSKLSNFLKVPTSHSIQDPIAFPFDNKLFTGIIKNYYIECSECNSSIIMQNAFGMNYLLSNTTDITYVATSYKNYSFAQSLNKIYRIGTQTNKIYDYAQLPFAANSQFCQNIVVEKNELYTISACSNFETWHFHVTSFVSSEPHVVGFFRAPMVKNIYKMLLIDNFLFIIDGSIPLVNQFNGVHIFSISFNNELVAETQDLLNNWVYYLTTFTQQGAMKEPLLSFDIVPTLTPQTYKFFVSTQSGMLYYNDVSYSSPSTITFNDWSQYNLLQYITTLDPELQSIQNAPFDSSLSGVKVFNFNYTASTQFSSYQMIVVFKNWHSYDTVFSIQPQRAEPVLQIMARLNRYAFYENQGNIETTIDNNGFVMFSTFLPNYLIGLNYSQHIIVAYDRTNTSGTQLTQLAGTTGNQYPQTTILSGISFYGNNLDFAMLPQNISGNHSALLISPDNFSLISCTLAHQPAIYFKNTEKHVDQIVLTASSEFSSVSQKLNVKYEKGKKIKNKVWIVFVVLVIVVTLCGLMVLIQILLSKSQKQAANEGLLEEN